MKRSVTRGFLLVIGVAITGLFPAVGVSEAQTAPPVIYTAAKAPSVPTLEALPLKESVSQYGITWTFEEPTRVGQFVNGDYYVVGPVTIKEIDPKPLLGKDVPEKDLDERESRVKEADRVRNGSMLNPPAKPEVAFDSSIRNWFRPRLAAKLPIDMKPGNSLVSSISLKQGEKAAFVYQSSGLRAEHDNCPAKVAAVLTCVAEPLAADAFRPSYGDRKQTLYYARNLKRDLLPKLEKVKSAPDPVKFAAVFQKPWFNTASFGFDQPMENMPHYGQWVGQAVGNAGLLLCQDYSPEQKEQLLINFVQVGIDLGGLVRAGHPGWEAFGGHGSGRKFPIVFAGLLLGDDELANISKSFPKTSFGEDEQTAYGDSWTGAKVVFTGHRAIDQATGKARAGSGPYEHRAPSTWGGLGGGPTRNGDKMSESYRRANTSCCWVGQALVLRILKAEKQWNHDAFFDYVDRWMNEDDKDARQEINKYSPSEALVNASKTWFHQGYAGEAWVKEAWSKYRPLSAAPTDGWKKQHDDSYYRNSMKKAGEAEPAK